MLKIFIKKLISAKPKTAEEFQQAKRRVAKELKCPMPGVSGLLGAYRELLARRKIKRQEVLERLLKRRAVRTISGIAPITVLAKPYGCPGQCIYCPTEAGMPKSYLSNEPAAARAKRLNFDPYTQVYTRLRTLFDNGHHVDKLELIVKGGTWGSYPWPYEMWFIRRCYEGANEWKMKKRISGKSPFIPLLQRGKEGDFTEKDPSLSRGGYLPENLKQEEKKLLKAQKQNERAHCRVIGLTLETRPDWVDAEKMRRMRLLGATRIELGVQHTDDKIQKLTKRGHKIEEVKKATRMLRDAGFKVDFHLMPQLPGSTPEKDLAMFKKIFKDPDLRPDMIKIYPCAVLPQTELWEWWKQGKFTPYPDQDLIKMLIKVKSRIIPPYCRISRLIRDIPGQSIAAGNKVTNLRQVLQERMRKLGLACKCLRCREVGRVGEMAQKHKNTKTQKQVSTPPLLSPPKADPLCAETGGVGGLRNAHPQLFEQNYQASGGTEYFLSFEDKERRAVFAFLRLRLPKSPSFPLWKRGIKGDFFPELQGAALIRELHTYGSLVSLGQRPEIKKSEVQHGGFGKRLMEMAEALARKAGYAKMAVIAGIGVREYYKKLGYQQEGTYMVNSLWQIVKDN